MPKMNWGIKPGAVENFDRGKIFAPYAGAIPPTGVVYAWLLKDLKIAAAATEDGYPQLRAGLELYPRTREERKYKGYFKRTYSPVSDQTDFRYVPLLDALGVSDKEFRVGTMHKQDGTIYQIGNWKFQKGIILLAQLIEEPDSRDPNRVRQSIRDTWFGVYEGQDSDIDDDDIDGADVEEEEDDEWV